MNLLSCNAAKWYGRLDETSKDEVLCRDRCAAITSRHAEKPSVLSTGPMSFATLRRERVKYFEVGRLKHNK